MVTGVIMLVVLAVMFQLLVPSFSLFRTQMAFSQTHQSALVSSQKLKRELTNTGLPTLTLDPAQTAISFSPKDTSSPFDSSGRTRYAQQFILYYLSPDNKLMRKLWPLSSDTPPSDLFDGPDPARLTQALLIQARTSTNGSEKVLAPDVSHFIITDSGTDPILIEPPIIMELTCTKATDSERSQEFQTRLEVSPRSVEW